MTIAIEQEVAGRWVSEVLEIPGAIASGSTRKEAADRAKALALRAMADQLDKGEEVPNIAHLFLMTA